MAAAGSLLMWLCATALYGVSAQGASNQDASKPNIVFVLTDDQDIVLGGMDPMQKTVNLLGKQGMTFENAFVSCPICCPSRSSILTGKYIHNHGTKNNSIEGGCSSTEWQQTQEPEAFSVYLKQQGYTTLYAGKYLNRYGFDRVGGPQHVPPGWDYWYGLVGNSVFYDYKLSVNGTPENHGHDYLEDYLTDLINRKALDFLDRLHDNSSPFFLMLSTPACHEPFTSAPQYSHYYRSAQAPRNGSFNVKAHDKHWLMQQPIIPMPDDTIDFVDDYYQSRLRTLHSVDDLVEDVYNALRRKNLLDNTYIFFTSDHGYHLGQFGLPYDKREPYEFDIRIPMLIKGPGIRAGLVSQESAMTIDLGPTFIDLAGGTIPPTMDGKSLKPLWQNPATRHFRPNVLVEYSGEGKQSIPHCPQYDGENVFNCNYLVHCVCEDAWNNTWACVRATTDEGPIYKYCEFEDNDDFVEMYELTSDPNEFTNLAKTADPALVQKLKQELTTLKACSGSTCSTQKLKRLKRKTNKRQNKRNKLEKKKAKLKPATKGRKRL